MKLKMRQYGLSKMKLLNLLQRPDRKETGIADGTMAVMKSNKSFSPSTSLRAGKTKKPNGEIWLMYKDNPSTGSGQAIRKIISAWRYPGVSKPGEEIPIPKEIREELLHESN